jgi:hypothetical protein
LLDRLGQLGHTQERPVADDRGSTARRLVKVLRRVEQPVGPVGESSQRRQLG